MGKKLREEDLVLNIIVNGDRGRKEINQLERSIIDSRAAISKLAAEQKKLEKQGKADSAQYAANKTAIDRYNASIKTAEERVALLRKGMKLEEMSISDLQKKLAQLTRVRNASIPGSEQWVKASNEIKVIADRLVTLKKKSADTNLSVCKMAEGVNKYIGLLSAGGLSILSMVSGMNRARAAFAEYDDKLSDVMKTTGLTKEETEALSDRLKRINTRTPQLELLDLARVAGKLGLSALEDVEGFVRAADKINVALSEDLGGNAEEALNKVGKLVDIFDLKKKYGIEDAMIRVGSTINELGAASTANEGYVVEFTNRLAGVAPQAGISIENVMGYGATLDQFGQQCETAATTVSQALTGMFKKPAEYARIAGMSLSEFNTLLNRDANAAFITFLRGLKNSEGGMSGMTRNLASLKLEGTRATQILGALATNVDTLVEQQVLANQAFADGMSIIDEFNTKNNNAQAQYEKSVKIIKNWTVEIGRSLTPAYYSLTNVIADLASTSQQQLEQEYEQYKSNRKEIEQKGRILDELTQKYVELKSKASLTETEQLQLNNTIREIGSICPQAINKMDDYGQAIEISITRLKRATEAQEALNRAMGEKFATDAVSEIKKQQEALEEARRSFQEAADNAYNIDAGNRDRKGWSFNPLLIGGMIHRETDTEAESRVRNERETETKKMQDAQSVIAESNANIRQTISLLYEAGNSLGEISRLTGMDLTQVIDYWNDKYRGAFGAGSAVNTPQNSNDGDLVGPSASTTKNTQWSLDKDQQFVKAKLALSQKLAVGEIDNEQEYSRQLLALEIQTLEQRIALNAEKGDKLLKLKSELADRQARQTKSEQARYEKLIAAGSEAGGGNDTQRLMDQERASFEKRLKDLGLFNKNREEMTSTELDALTNLERNYRQKVQSIYMDGIVRRFNEKKAALDREHSELKIAHNEELASLTTFEAKKEKLSTVLSANELDKIRTDKQANAALKKYYEDEERKDLQVHLEEMLKFYEAYMAEISDIGVTGVGKMNDEERKQLQAKIDELKKQLAELRGEKTDSGTGSAFKGKDVLGFSKEDWDNFFTHLEEGKLKIEDWQLALSVVGQTFGQISQLMSAAEQREFSEYEKTAKKKKKSLDNQLKAGKISQEQYSNQVQMIDEETDRKKEELSRKQAAREKALAIFQAMANTAVGVTAALKMGPIIGPILAAVVGALGAAQVAAIAATPLPGAEQGGWIVERRQDGRRFRAKNDPDRRGYVSDPRVIVAENGTEYVVPNEGYENPTIRPVLDIIEQARRTGTLRSINLPAVLGAYTVRGRAGGGYADPSIPMSDATDDSGWPVSGAAIDPEMVRQLANAIDKLNRRIEKPLEVKNYAGGRYGTRRALDKYDRIRDNASL